MNQIAHRDWLPERARWGYLGSSGLQKFPPKPNNKFFIDQAFSDKMAGYWPRSFFRRSLWTSTPSRSMPVVYYVVFKPRYCRVSVELGRGKSLICITVESMRWPIVITLGSSILMKCLGKSLLFKLSRQSVFLHTNVDFLHTNSV